MTDLTSYGRTPLTGLAALHELPTLRHLYLGQCYSFDAEALAELPVRRLLAVRQPDSFDPEVLAQLRQLTVPTLHLPALSAP